MIKSKNGYEIKYDEIIPKNPKMIIIAMHGFAGDRFSGCINLLKQKALPKNYGIINFDWPSHGESPTNDLTIEGCLSDLKTVIDYVKERYPNVFIGAFSTSFGGYLTLLYNALYNDFSKIVLRAPAIEMDKVLKNKIMTAEDKKNIEKNGYFIYGFERKIKITKQFIEELEKNDVLKMYDDLKKYNKIHIIHGSIDDIVPIEMTITFANKYGCTVNIIDGADHRFKKDGELDKVVDDALYFYNKN